MYPDNSWYSHRFILSKYCGVNPNIPIYGSLLHGHTPVVSRFYKKLKIIIGKRKFNLAPAFFWNKEQVKYAKKKGIKNVCAIGAPFLYLHKLKKKIL